MLFSKSQLRVYFRIFQPWYCYKIYSNERKKCSLSRMETFCLRIVKKKNIRTRFPHFGPETWQHNILREVNNSAEKLPGSIMLTYLIHHVHKFSLCNVVSQWRDQLFQLCGCNTTVAIVVEHMKSFLDFTNLIRCQFCGFQHFLLFFRHGLNVIIVVVLFICGTPVFVKSFVVFLVRRYIIVVWYGKPIASRFVFGQSRSWPSGILRW